MRDLRRRVARGLQDLGVGVGAHIGLHLANVPHYIACFFGVLKAGARAVNFSPLYAEREIQHQIEDSEIEVMITLDWQSLYPKLAQSIAGGRLKAVIVCSLEDFLPAGAAARFNIPTVAIPQSSIGAVRLVRFRDLIAHDGAYRPRQRA